MLSGSTLLAPGYKNLVLGGGQLESSCAVHFHPAGGRGGGQAQFARKLLAVRPWQVVGALGYGGASSLGPHP